jgi:NAD(P)-dependent dehydrogenase (short-subunit alcohol dehydrogenase family)
MPHVTDSRPRVSLVTGANKGIGRAIVEGLAGSGFVVYLGARDEVRGRAAVAELAGHGQVRLIQIDVTNESSVRAAAKQIEADFGLLDVLVNNAGISGVEPGGIIRKPSELTANDFRLVYETNVFAVVTVTNALLPLLRKSPAGRIVNITSKRGSIGEKGAWVGQPYMPYSSSKTALNALTAHYARELADTPIKVNGAAPGHVATDFNNFRGTRTVDEGAAVAIWLAQLAPDGPTGQVFEDGQSLAW